MTDRSTDAVAESITIGSRSDAELSLSFEPVSGGVGVSGRIEGLANLTRFSKIVQVFLRRSDTGSEAYVSTRVSGDGTFMFPSVPPGIYRVTTQPRLTSQRTVTLEVKNVDVTGFVVAVP